MYLFKEASFWVDNTGRSYIANGNKHRFFLTFFRNDGTATARMTSEPLLRFGRVQICLNAYAKCIQAVIYKPNTDYNNHWLTIMIRRKSDMKGRKFVKNLCALASLHEEE